MTQTDKAPKIRAKKLEWKDNSEIDSIFGKVSTAKFAGYPDGEFIIYNDALCDDSTLLEYDQFWFEGEENFLTLEAAKAAAQAHADQIAAEIVADPWQDISTAPKDGTEILAWVGPSYRGGWLQLSWLETGGHAAWRDWDHDIWEPTRWQHIAPPAPQEKDNE